MRKTQFTRLLRDETGATAVEYGLIVTLIAVAAITAIVSVGNEVTTKFNTVETSYSAANS